MTFINFVVCKRFSGSEDDYHNFIDSYSSEILAPILEMWVIDYINFKKQ